MDSDSIHVPGSVARPAKRVIGYLLPSAVAGLWVLVGASFGWIESRASRKDVADKIAPVAVAAKAAQSSALTGASLAKEHAVELKALWVHIVRLEAEAKVLREYGSKDPARRNALIDRARNFYEAKLNEQLETHADNPAEAAYQALLVEWRP